MTTKKVANPTTHRTCFIYTTCPSISNEMLDDELSNGYYDKQEEAKTDAQDMLENDGGDVYLYKVQITRVLKGTKPPATWTKL